MKVTIDRDGCISCGLCEGICPAVFRIGDDGLAEVYSEPTAENAGQVQEAAQGCPVAVIHAEG